MEDKVLDFVPEFHEIAGEFPFANDEELKAMAADIKEHGLTDPITLYENMVLDGRNRYMACDIANVDCRYTTFEGTYAEAEAESARLNLRRRNMSPDQLAAVAFRSSKSVRAAAEFYGINRNRISRVSAIAKQDEALVDRIFEGRITIAKASALVKYRLIKEDEMKLAIKSIESDKPSKLGLEAEARYQLYCGMSVKKLAWELMQRDFSDEIKVGEEDLL